MKKIYLAFFASAFMHSIAISQLVTADPGQTAQNATMIAQNTAMLQQAIETFHTAQEGLSQAKASYSELVQMKDYMVKVEERLQNIGDIKQLKLNNVNAILDRILCIKQGNYYPKTIRFLEIIALMQSAFLNCNNDELYNKTYSGALQTLDMKVQAAGNAGGPELNDRLNDFNKDLAEAEKTNQATNAHNARIKLELGLKYKMVSDTLMYMSAEVSRAVNQDASSDKNIALSPAERLKLMDLANQYQLQALDYEEKSARLLKEASEADAEQQRQIKAARRHIANKQMINFQL